MKNHMAIPPSRYKLNIFILKKLKNYELKELLPQTK